MSTKSISQSTRRRKREVAPDAEAPLAEAGRQTAKLLLMPERKKASDTPKQNLLRLAAAVDRLQSALRRIAADLPEETR